VYLISEKLDIETRKQWELSGTGNTIQTYADLKKFLEARSRKHPQNDQEILLDNSILPFSTPSPITPPLI
jgi:hypothetical protein